jgi:hypothetical protein
MWDVCAGRTLPGASGGAQGEAGQSLLPLHSTHARQDRQKWGEVQQEDMG